MKRFGLVAAMAAALAMAMPSTHAAETGKAAKGRADKGKGADKGWAYAGKTGPQKWGDLEADFAECKLGQNQSPIDIPDANARKGDFPTLLFQYKPSPLKIVDDGHTIQVNYAPGSTVTANDKRYELVQFHFHKPSEEKINGRGHDMVAHLVHKDAQGKLVYIAVLLDAGKPNPLMKAVIDNLPKEKGAEVTTATTINVVDLLPDNTGYYSYTGSLTTPPCSESVTWFVLKKPTTISPDSIARFGKVYPMNARPVQPLNSRDIIATRQ